MRFLSLLSVCLFSCSPARSPDGALVLHRAQDTAAIEQALAGLDPARFEVRAEAELAVITTEGLCAECYRLERDGLRVTLTAGGAPGLQYGFTQWLDRAVVRFLGPLQRAPRRRADESVMRERLTLITEGLELDKLRLRCARAR